MNDVPFHEVYIHALIRDEHGEKMSKSKGNVIDPLVMMEKYGTDAFRFTLAVLAAQGRDIKLSESRIESYRNFITKLWNAARFVFLNTGTVSDITHRSLKGLANKWILSRLHRTIENTRKFLDSYEFDRAAQTLYLFTWNEFCDWFIETAKFNLQAQDVTIREETAWTLRFVLEVLLRLLHPFIPFITEELHNLLMPQEEKFVATMAYPTPGDARFFPDAEENMKGVMSVVTSIRNTRSTYNIPPAQKLNVVLREHQPGSFTPEMLELINHLANLESVQIAEANWSPEKGTSRDVTEKAEVYIPLGGIVDFEKEYQRLSKKISKMRERLKQLTEKLQNEAFLKNAPAEVVQKIRTEAVRVKSELEVFTKNLEEIDRMARSS